MAHHARAHACIVARNSQNSESGKSTTMAKRPRNCGANNLKSVERHWLPPCRTLLELFRNTLFVYRNGKPRHHFSPLRTPNRLSFHHSRTGHNSFVCCSHIRNRKTRTAWVSQTLQRTHCTIPSSSYSQRNFTHHCPHREAFWQRHERKRHCRHSSCHCSPIFPHHHDCDWTHHRPRPGLHF